MKARIFALAMGLCLTAAACFAADPNVGTWKLNQAKSKIVSGAPKNDTVVYEAEGDQMKVTIDGSDADGKPTHNEWTGKFDGKDYPVTGSTTEDSRSVKKVNARTLAVSLKKDGKVVGSGRIVLAPDGKSRTVTITRTGADGKKIVSRAVYDKQ